MLMAIVVAFFTFVKTNTVNFARPIRTITGIPAVFLLAIVLINVSIPVFADKIFFIKKQERVSVNYTCT